MSTAMRAYSRQHRPLESIITADQYIGVTATPPMIEFEREGDLDTYMAMPELVSFRQHERQAVEVSVGEIEDVSSGSSRRESATGGLHRSRRISGRLADLGRKAKDSFANLVYRKDSLIREGDVVADDQAQIARGLTTESILGEEQLLMSSSESSADHIEVLTEHGLADWPLDTMHLHTGNPRRPSLHLTQVEAGDLLAQRLQAGIRAGEFRDDIRDAIFAARHVHTTEEEQWDASYDFMRASAERRQRVDEAWRQGVAPLQEGNEEIDLSLLPDGYAPL